MSAIPIHNLYYLLSYAWEMLPQMGSAPVAKDDSRSAVDLLVLMFAGGVEMLGRRGLIQDYQERVAETPRLQGRVNFSESLRRMTNRNARMICEYDELAVDNVVNGILRSTLDRLLKSASVERTVRHRLLALAPLLAQVPPVKLQGGLFSRVILPRHRQLYKLVLAVCEMLYQLAQPDESGSGFHFRDPWEAQRMPELFERFVRNFLRKHLSEAEVGRPQFPWQAEGMYPEDQLLLPMMKTDVCIKWQNHRCLILDCKFYKDAFVSQYDQVKLHSGNLYQMAAYLHNHPAREAGALMHGLLLYPTVDTDFLHRYHFIGHKLTVASLDLMQPWKTIHERLLDVIALSCPE